jgi:hypothetical protein
MKTFLLLLANLLALGIQAQTVRVPILLSADIPLPPSTNITYVTNIFIITNASTLLIALPNDAVDAKLGPRLIRFVSSPPIFTFTNFAPSAFTTLYWSNPAGLSLRFQTNNVFWFGVIPTNQVRGALLIEAVGNELWLTP